MAQMTAWLQETADVQFIRDRLLLPVSTVLPSPVFPVDFVPFVVVVVVVVMVVIVVVFVGVNALTNQPIYAEPDCSYGLRL